MHSVKLLLQDLGAAEHAYERVRVESEALTVADLSPLNVDLISATSVAIGAAPQILAFRDRMVALPEFEARCVDRLLDYATAAWFVYISNLPTPEPAEADALVKEVSKLRAKLLVWASALVTEGKFDAEAVDRIKEGSGLNKDAPSDLVALVGLFRSKWSEVENMCAVTAADLDRGAQIGPMVFALVSFKEAKNPGGLTDGSLRVRRVWTLLDKAYRQCRRALQYLRYDEEDVDLIAPSLRRNSGVPRPTVEDEPTPPDSVAPDAPPGSAGQWSAPGPVAGAAGAGAAAAAAAANRPVGAGEPFSSNGA